jgi:ribonucleotide monophosphatase NagD (HAD superfamily)
MIGDRMDTDVVAGMEAGLNTILVLSGVTRREAVGPVLENRRGPGDVPEPDEAAHNARGRYRGR